MFNADELKKKFLNDIETARSESQLSDVWKTYLSKNGSVQGLMNGIKEVAKEEKKAYGQFVNEVKNWVQEKYDEKKKEIEELELQQKYERETIDVTVPVKTRPMGNLHPLTAVKYEMINVFAGMGFEIFEGPEIEDDDHNFTRLCRIHSGSPTICFSAHIHHRDRFVQWMQRSLLSRYWFRVRYSVRTQMQHIHRCSARWKVLL